jgi:hypothetical protein
MESNVKTSKNMVCTANVCARVSYVCMEALVHMSTRDTRCH